MTLGPINCYLFACDAHEYKSQPPTEANADLGTDNPVDQCPKCMLTLCLGIVIRHVIFSLIVAISNFIEGTVYLLLTTAIELNLVLT